MVYLFDNKCIRPHDALKQCVWVEENVLLRPEGQKLYNASCFAYFLDKTPDAMKPPLYFFQNFLPIFLLVSKFKFIFAAGL